MNPDTIRIGRVIIHDVPKHLRVGGGREPTLSEGVSPLPPDSREYFQSQIIRESHSERSFEVMHDPTVTSPLPAMLENQFSRLLNEDEAFIDISKTFARHLYSIQNGQNPGGILAILDGTCDSGSLFACLKLEREEGLGLHQKEIDGRRTFLAEHLTNLVLTQKTRLFKLAVFFRENGHMLGRVRDSQMGYMPNREVATFFLRFLGVRLVEQPDVTTRMFFELSQTFIQGAHAEPSVLEPSYNVRKLTGLLVHT